MKNNHTNWHGAWAAITTPMKNNKIDTAALIKHTEFLIQNNIDGIVACGTTGEAATLSTEEKMLVISTVVETTKNTVPVIAGAGTNDTKTTIELAKAAKNNGADGLLLVTPYYNKPNQEGLLKHFLQVAEAVELPQIIYNVPSRTVSKAEVSTLARLSEHPNIVGTKDATADMAFATRTIAATKPGFLIFSGDDATTLPLMLIGGHGTISVAANVVPQKIHELCRLAREKNLENANILNRQLMDLFQNLFVETNPIPVKAILSKMNLGIENELRSPLFPMTNGKLEELIKTSQKYITS